MSVVTENDVSSQGSQVFHLELALDGLSKDILTSIRKHAAIKNVSKLNREQLKQALVEQLPQAYDVEFQSLLALFDQERVQILEEVIRRKGIIPFNNQLTEQQLQYWLELGLLFHTTIDQKEVIAMPEQLVEVIASQLKTLDRKAVALNTTLIETVKGMMYYYGALSHEQIGEILNRYPVFEQLQAPYMHVIINYRHYHNDVGLTQQYVHHAAIPEPSLIVKEQNQRKDLPFASFTALELQKAGAPRYINRTQAHQLLVDCFMKQFKIPQLEALLVADQSEFGIRAGLQLQDLVEYMKRELVIQDEQTLNVLLPRLIIMYNHTVQWFLKGHHSASLSSKSDAKQESESVQPELSQTSVAPQIGRNDPCYCGSGKKYKKCCMNK